MEIKGKKVFVTGANRGIGRAFVEAFLKAGADKVYAAVRSPEKVRDLADKYPGRVVPVRVDVTDQKLVDAAAKQCSDANVLVNNAGVLLNNGAVNSKNFKGAIAEMETNYLGTLRMMRAFAPVLKNNGGGAIINICSIASFIDFPAIGTYCASKAAEYIITKTVREELRNEGIQVIAVYPGPIDTDMTAGMELEKAPASQVAEKALSALKEGKDEVFPDDMSENMHAEFIKNPKLAEKEAAEMFPPVAA